MTQYELMFEEWVVTDILRIDGSEYRDVHNKTLGNIVHLAAIVPECSAVMNVYDIRSGKYVTTTYTSNVQHYEYDESIEELRIYTLNSVYVLKRAELTDDWFADNDPGFEEEE